MISSHEQIWPTRADHSLIGPDFLIASENCSALVLLQYYLDSSTISDHRFVAFMPLRLSLEVRLDMMTFTNLFLSSLITFLQPLMSHQVSSCKQIQYPNTPLDLSCFDFLSVFD